jgi:hypothetical protein
MLLEEHFFILWFKTARDAAETGDVGGGQRLWLITGQRKRRPAGRVSSVYTAPPGSSETVRL